MGWEVVKASSAAGLGFDPAAGSSRGRATCRICGAAITYNYVRIDRVADRLSTLCRLDVSNEGGTNTFARQALPMVWDFWEANPFGGSSGDVRKYLKQAAT